MNILENKNVRLIYDYLNGLCDVELSNKISEETISKCYQYIIEEARKMEIDGCAMIGSDVVFGWARHFFDENMFTDEKWKKSEIQKQLVNKKEQKNLDDKLKAIEKKKAEKRKEQKAYIEQVMVTNITVKVK